MIYDMYGNELSSVYDVQGNELESAYDMYGNEVFSGGSPVPPVPQGIEKYENYTIEMMGYQTPCGQDFAYYDGKIVAATETQDVLKVINASTGAALASAFSVSIGHCNSIVFSDEFYSPSDTFPLLCATYSGLDYYRIANTYDSAERVKKYFLQSPSVDTSTVWYGLGFDNGYFYTIGYTSGTYQQSANNFILLAKYDLQNPIDNGDNTYTLPLVYTKRREWFECIQGSEVHDGFFWVNSGFTNSGHVYAIDLTSAKILLDIPLAEYTTLEMEALTWESDSTLIVSSKNAGSNLGMYRITFPDVQQLS